MGKHAMLSPSGADRWLKCPPSARLEQQFPDTSSEAAKEGTLAHSLGELILKLKLDRITKQKYTSELIKIKKDALYNAAMHDYAEDYTIFVLERYYEAQAHTEGAAIFLEQRLDMTRWVPEGFGTGDSSIVSDHLLEIIDLKYGKGVPVSAEGNKQLRLYALGALNEFDIVFDIKAVRMTIYQPRLDNFSSEDIDVADLYQWAETELVPAAKKAFDGLGDFAPGLHCRFCRAKGVCKALADYNLEIAQYDFKKAVLMQPDEIADVLDRSSLFKSWVTGVEEYALSQALTGTKWPGYKLVEGRSNRMYSDTEAVAKKLLDGGFAETVIYKKELLGITNMEKAITKNYFKKHLSTFIIKPKGAPTLAPLADKRPELNSTADAQKDFAEFDDIL